MGRREYLGNTAPPPHPKGLFPVQYADYGETRGEWEGLQSCHLISRASGGWDVRFNKGTVD